MNFKHKLSPVQEQGIKKQYAAGATLDALAAQYSVCHTTIEKAVAGATRKRGRRPGQKYNPIRPERRNNGRSEKVQV